ncbi:hypothetical protein PPTG_12794 [Phytophthora nicotianae INRA-310]|uniref:Integrase zinc-binding domain-containing protein n=1 Tax=Phytophthora nicotianae (strain INRA-310) TaxID=761204 RepID=W2Q0P8_PHYN3|nr:hypothetical protein PPTG_12794 [Phytophthora nicotianae INRA-310]ETN06763.1 hypothetical protein PPTG_12794 [Phytophthora nicotianae INRA-310]
MVGISLPRQKQAWLQAREELRQVQIVTVKQGLSLTPSLYFGTRRCTYSTVVSVVTTALPLPRYDPLGQQTCATTMPNDASRWAEERSVEQKKNKDWVNIRQGLQRQEERVCVKYDLLDGVLVVKGQDAVRVLRIPQVYSILLRVMHDFHDAAVVAHPGVERTMVAMRQYFWWPGMREHIAQYFATCEACVRHKSGSRRRKGLLQSLPIPDHCWQHVTTELIQH